MLNCNDPLIELFTEQGYNLIKTPKAKIEPLQILIKSEMSKWQLFKNNVYLNQYTTLEKFLTEDSVGLLNDIIQETQAANQINASDSNTLSRKTSLELLKNLLPLESSQKASLATLFEKINSTSFKIADTVTEKSVMLFDLEQCIERASFIKDIPKVLKKRIDVSIPASKEKTTLSAKSKTQKRVENGEFYIIIAVLKSTSFEMKINKKNKQDIKVESEHLENIFKVNAEIGIELLKQSQNTVRFTSKTPLTVAFKAVKLFYEKQDNGDKILTISKEITGKVYRGDEHQSSDEKESPYNFFTSLENFLDI
ncbi:MAG: hypothetical protein ACPG5B_13475 [Chitinophagales bacterium]